MTYNEINDFIKFGEENIIEVGDMFGDDWVKQAIMIARTFRQHLDDTGLQDYDFHIGCFSYPNCDLAPNGCVILNGDKAEQYGFRD
jgi:hypothetical protein